MPTALVVLKELERAREQLDRDFEFPWREQRSPSPIWSHPALLRAYELLPADLHELVRGLLVRGVIFRCMGLYLIAELRLSEFAFETTDHLLHGHLAVRALAAAALGSLGDEASVEGLLLVRDTEHPEVKRAVIDAFERLRDDRCIPVLARWIGRSGEDEGVRRRVCRCLIALADDASMPALTRVLDDETAPDDLRILAVTALQRIGGPESRTRRLGGLAANRPMVRQACLNSLLETSDPYLASEFLTIALAPTGTRGRAEALRGLHRLATAEAITKLLPLAKDPDLEVRIEAVAFFERVGGEVAKSGLTQALVDHAPEVGLQGMMVAERLLKIDLFEGWNPTDVLQDARHYRLAIQRAASALGAWIPNSGSHSAPPVAPPRVKGVEAS